MFHVFPPKCSAAKIGTIASKAGKQLTPQSIHDYRVIAGLIACFVFIGRAPVTWLSSFCVAEKVSLTVTRAAVISLAAAESFGSR